MNRKQFFEWLATCPANEETDETDENGEWKFSLRSGYRVLDDFGEVKVHFWFEETETETEEPVVTCKWVNIKTPLPEYDVF